MYMTPEHGVSDSSAPRKLLVLALTVATLPTASAFAACPAGAQPPDPSIESQLAVVDMMAPRFAQQARSYPPTPHLNPKLVAEAMKNGTYRGQFKFVISHRGGHGESGYAENGLSGIWRAYQAGADGVELDIKTDCQDPGRTLLGHDFAVGRELDIPTFDLYKYFPATDPVYGNPANWPFRVNNTVNDPNNPNRLTNYIGSYWNKPLNDQFDSRSIFGDGQITAVQGMYYTARYAPMMVWLDVKNRQDLISSASEIRAVRSILPQGNTNLDYVGLKLGAGTLRDPAVNFNPAVATGTSGLLYYAVLGLGDLDRVKADGAGNLVNGLQLYCKPANGCIGIELAHKYENAPTQPVVDFVKLAAPLDLAGFHTVPQYDWANFVKQELSPGGLPFVRNFNRTFPRTDASCCFSLDDSLNIGLGKSELLDRRGSYNWNINTFGVITSDDATNLLRRLYALQLRPTAIVNVLGGDVPAGIANSVADALYGLYVAAKKCWISASTVNQALTCTPNFTRDSIFNATAPALQGAGAPKFQLSTTTGLIARSSPTQVVAASVLTTLPLSATTVRLYLYQQGFFNGQVVDDATNRAWIVAGDNTIQFSNTAGDLVAFVPIRQAQLENDVATNQTENRIGPPGSVLWCDDGQVCGGTHSLQTAEQVAYGVKGKWVYKYYSAGSRNLVECTALTFGSDPAPGQSKACYRQPSLIGRVAPGYLVTVAEGQPLPQGASALTYGSTDPSLSNWFGNYGTPAQLANATVCQNFAGAPSPIGGTKTCRVSTDPILLTNFAPCGSNEAPLCALPTPHSVALAYFGPSGLSYTYKTFSQGLRCFPDEFGISGNSQPVACFARVIGATDPKVDNYTWCSKLNQTCRVGSGDKFLAAYADNSGHVYYAQLQGSFTCNLQTFNQTGSPDPSAACFYRLY